MSDKPTFFKKLKNIFLGEARNPFDQSVFHNISLVAFFAWIGLGSDGLSSSAYGPAEAFITLGKYHYLGIIIALATAFTIFIISNSYSQIIELFPSGGGAYFVASRLLSPTLGMISGSALLIDYVLTITISVASGADALFSFLPSQFIVFKLWFAVAMIFILIFLNLRGVKESVTVLMPIFLLFIVSHAFILLYALFSHFMYFPSVVGSTGADIKLATSELGFIGMFMLLMRAYSMGAGTYTGIEAVSNGVSMLREPRVATAKKTMNYMFLSLTLVVLGIMFSYVLYGVQPQFGKTLNAVLFESIAAGWGIPGYIFVLLTLISEAAILFVAAQTGFLGGPRVLANMAADKWAPKRFTLLSDRLVTMNGVLIMGIASLIVMVATNGSVVFLVVLYSINVFITFCLAQLGMVKHWWEVKGQNGWLSKMTINGVGLILTTFILVMVTFIKFHEGGWITLFITGTLVMFMYLIKRGYDKTDKLIGKFDNIVKEVETQKIIPQISLCNESFCEFNPKDKTAVILVKDFTGVGLKTIFGIFKSFGGVFKNFIFVQVGLIDAGAFRDKEELEKVKRKVESEVNHYVDLMKRHGYHAEGFYLFGTDTVEEISKVAVEILDRYPNATFFGGQTIFPNSFFMSRLLHNYTLFSTQHRLYKEGIPLFILPIEIS